MLTGPQQMPVFSDGVLKPEEKRDIIAYLKSIENDPELRRRLARLARSRSARASPPGSSASAPCVGFAVWIASHSVRSKKGVKA